MGCRELSNRIQRIKENKTEIATDDDNSNAVGLIIKNSPTSGESIKEGLVNLFIGL